MVAPKHPKRRRLRQSTRNALRYSYRDVAAEIGIHPASLTRYLTKHKMGLVGMTLGQLFQFIEDYKERMREMLKTDAP